MHIFWRYRISVLYALPFLLKGSPLVWENNYSVNNPIKVKLYATNSLENWQKLFKLLSVYKKPLVECETWLLVHYEKLVKLKILN